MRRRKFAIGLLVGVLASSSAIRAQVVRKVYRIGVLSLGTTPDMTGPNPVSPSVKALLRGMRDLGYVYGEQYVTEPRGSGGDPDRDPALAAELVRIKVDVIVGGGPSVPALKQATT